MVFLNSFMLPLFSAVVSIVLIAVVMSSHTSSAILPSDSEAQITFNRIPISTLLSEIEEEAKQKWQKEWEEGTKAAITKEFFPEVQDRQELKIVINPVFTTMVTGHGKTRSYLHRFRILEHATCPCGKGEKND